MARDIGGKRAMSRKRIVNHGSEDFGMATTRSAKSKSRASRRPVAKITKTSKGVQGAKSTKPTYTAEQLRKAFPGAVKEIKIEIHESDLKGTISDISKRLANKAKGAKIVGEFVIDKFTPRDRWGYSKGSKWAIRGSRPYTDAELVAAGEKLIKSENNRIQSQYKKELKKVQEFNRLASSLGQPLMPEPTKPEPIKL